MVAAADIARSTGKLILDGQHEIIHASTLGPDAADIVSSTDKAAEEYIVRRLEIEFPDDAISGKEGTSRPGTSSRRWIVEPIDSTVNFVRDFSISAISLAVEIDGVPSIGVVYNPFNDEMFAAGNGIGAFLNDARLPIRLEDIIPTRAIVGLSGGNRDRSRIIRAEVARRAIQQAGDLRYSGSTALDLCNVACGRMDAMFACGVSAWEITAGTVIARETGCVAEGPERDSEPTGDHTMAAAVSYAADFRNLVQAAVDTQLASVGAGWPDRSVRAWPKRHSDW